MSLSAKEPLISHECLNCHRHHPRHAVVQSDIEQCPSCGSGDIEALRELEPAPLPPLHARQVYHNSAYVHASLHGIDANELHEITQVVQRLAGYSTTVVTKQQAETLSKMVDLGYLTLAPTEQGTFEAESQVTGALLSSYYWSVWIPRYLQARGYQTLVMPHLQPDTETQHCSVAFRISGSREATRHFLADLADRFNDLNEAEIVHIQAGNVFDGPRPDRIATVLRKGGM